MAALHDVAQAARSGGRPLAIQGGRVVAEGAPRDVLTEAMLRDVVPIEAWVRWEGELPVCLPIRSVA